MIDRTTFEAYAPVAKEATGQIYQQALPTLILEEQALCKQCRGTQDRDVRTVQYNPNAISMKSPGVQPHFARVVVLRTLLQLIRQFDAVMTPTGLGVVSTENLAPASAHRTDALERVIRENLLRAEGRFIYELITDGLNLEAESLYFWGYPELMKDMINPMFFCGLGSCGRDCYPHRDYSQCEDPVGEYKRMQNSFTIGWELLEMITPGIKNNTVLPRYWLQLNLPRRDFSGITSRDALDYLYPFFLEIHEKGEAGARDALDHHRWRIQQSREARILFGNKLFNIRSNHRYENDPSSSGFLFNG